MIKWYNEKIIAKLQNRFYKCKVKRLLTLIIINDRFLRVRIWRRADENVGRIILALPSSETSSVWGSRISVFLKVLSLALSALASSASPGCCCSFLHSNQLAACFVSSWVHLIWCSFDPTFITLRVRKFLAWQAWGSGRRQAKTEDNREMSSRKKKKKHEKLLDLFGFEWPRGFSQVDLYDKCRTGHFLFKGHFFKILIRDENKIKSSVFKLLMNIVDSQ